MEEPSSSDAHTRIIADDTNYSGESKDDLANGIRKLSWPNGEIWEGEVKDGKRNGQGKNSWPDGAIYEGECKDNKQNGQGKMTYGDGSIYEGEWKDGAKHGQGKYSTTDGDIYEGQFRDDKQNGQGKMTSVNGQISQGEWKDGMGPPPQVTHPQSEKQGGGNWDFIFLLLKGFFKLFWWLASDNNTSSPNFSNHGRITHNFVCIRCGHVVTANLSNTPSKCSICDGHLRRQL